MNWLLVLVSASTLVACSRPRAPAPAEPGASAAPASAHVSASAPSTTEPVPQSFVYIGSGAWGKTEGGTISVYRLRSSGALDLVQSLPAGGLASYLTFTRDGQFMYAVDESGGAVRSFRVDPKSGRLALHGTRTAGGKPVYIALDHSERVLLTAHYDQGQIELFPRLADGGIGPSTGPRPAARQAHSILPTPDNRHLLVPAKGINKILRFGLDAADARTSKTAPAEFEAGAGPRHLTFHPRLPIAYVMNELDCTIRVYDYDAKRATLSSVQSVRALPDGFVGDAACADIQVSADARHLYGSARAGDASSIAVFALDASGRNLQLVEHEPSRGRTPRNFRLYPNGKLLLVGNQESNNVVTFRIHETSGALEHLHTTELQVPPFYVGVRLVN